MQAKTKLIKLMEDKKKISWPMITTDENEEVIILRDESGAELDYSDTNETIRMRKNLKSINTVLSNNIILLKIDDKKFKELNKIHRYDPNKQAVDFTRKKLKRIFNNGSWDQGGRFYGGWWQRIPKNFRHYVTINDKMTIEYDYSGLHINMLYAEQGLSLPNEDPYFLADYPDSRDFLKKSLQAIINAKDRKTALSAIQKQINFGEIEKPSNVKDLNDIIDKFVEKHKPISNSFYESQGVSLQYKDSKIAESILLHFADKDIPVLPVHDSFIIDIDLLNDLKRLMNEAFIDEYGIECKIKPEPFDLDPGLTNDQKTMLGKFIESNDGRLFISKSMNKNKKKDERESYSIYYSLKEEFEKSYPKSKSLYTAKVESYREENPIKSY
jgi:hypothetical protein